MRTTKPSQSSRIFSVGRWSTVLNIRNCSKDWTVSSFLMTEWPQFQTTFRLIANWSRLVFNPIQQVVTEANITCRPAKILSWQMKNDKTNSMLTQNLGIENEPVHHRVCYSFCTKHTYTWRKTENTVRKTTHSPLKHRNTQGWLHANKQASASMDAHTHIHTYTRTWTATQPSNLVDCMQWALLPVCDRGFTWWTRFFNKQWDWIIMYTGNRSRLIDWSVCVRTCVFA